MNAKWEAADHNFNKKGRTQVSTATLKVPGTHFGFSKPCGKAALPKGWLPIGRQVHSWVRKGCRWTSPLARHTLRIVTRGQK